MAFDPLYEIARAGALDARGIDTFNFQGRRTSAGNAIVKYLSKPEATCLSPDPLHAIGNKVSACRELFIEICVVPDAVLENFHAHSIGDKTFFVH